jgi:translation initiation factor 3 subunit G
MSTEYKSSWAEEVELDDGVLPLPSETTDAKGNKIIIEYRENEKGKREKVVKFYEKIRFVVSKNVARRKQFPKFGDSKDDVAGPNRRTTFVNDDIQLVFLDKEKEKKSDVPNPSKGD